MKFTQIPLLLGCLALSSAHRTVASAPVPPVAVQSTSTSPVARNTPLVDPLTGIVHSTLLRSGVPLGGIGTGCFELRTDGTIGHSSLRGITQRQLTEAPGCFAALWTRTERGTTAQTLALTSAYHLPTVATLDYDGLFPQANLSFPDPQLPVQTNLLAFSPLVPFDLKNSSFPAVAYVLRLKNPSPNPVEVSVALSWESLLTGAPTQPVPGAPSISAAQPTPPPGTRLPPPSTAGTAATIPSNGGYFGATFTPTGTTDAMTLLAYPDRAETVVTTALWDAADPTPAWWARFAQEGTVAEDTTPNTQRPTPNTNENPIPTNTPSASVSVPNTQHPTPVPSLFHFHRPGAVVAMHLVLKPGELVELPFAVSWYAKHQYGPSGVDVGHYYEVAFSGAEDAGRQLLADWRSLYGLTEEWQKRLMFSNLPRWSARRLIDAAAPLATNTIHTRDGRFTFQNSLQNSLQNAVGEEINTGNATTQSKSIPHDPGGRGEITQGHLFDPLLRAERLDTRSHEAIEPLLLTLYPQLAAQELTQLSALLDSRGLLPPPASSDWFARLGPAFPKRLPAVPGGDESSTSEKSGQGREKGTQASASKANRRPSNGQTPGRVGKTVPPPATLPPVAEAPMPAAPAPAPVLPALDPLDANADYLLALTRFALWTGDMDFIKPHAQEFQRASRALIALRTASSTTSTELDRGTKPLKPASLSHWLAAVRASQSLAGLLGDSALEHQCADAAREGSAEMEASLWNGEFYALPSSLSPSVGQPNGKSNGTPAPESVCSSDQLWGQWMAYQLGLGPLLPMEHLLRASQSVQSRNDNINAKPMPPAATPTQIPFPFPFPFPFTWQVCTDGKPLNTEDPAASGCLLPASILSDASVALWQNQPEVAMNQLLALDNLRNNLLRSPWQYPTLLNSSSANSPSLAAASDWNILYALQGFGLDINRGELTLTPHLPGYWQNFNAPVFAPTFWGRMEYHPTAHGGTLTFRLDRLIGFIATPAQTLLKNRAELTLQTMKVPGPPFPDKTPPTTITAHVSHGRNPLGCRATLEADGTVTIRFDSPLTMTAGDRLQVDIR